MCIYGWDYPPTIHPSPLLRLFVYVPRPPCFNSFSKGISFRTDTDILPMDKANRYIITNLILDCILYSMDIALLIS